MRRLLLGLLLMIAAGLAGFGTVRLLSTFWTSGPTIRLEIAAPGKEPVVETHTGPPGARLPNLPRERLLRWDAGSEAAVDAPESDPPPTGTETLVATLTVALPVKPERLPPDLREKGAWQQKRFQLVRIASEAEGEAILRFGSVPDEAFPPQQIQVVEWLDLPAHLDDDDLIRTASRHLVESTHPEPKGTE